MIEFKMNDATYRLVSDTYCWVVQKQKIQGKDSKTPGAIKWTNEIFSNDFHHIAKWLINRGVKERAEIITTLEEMQQVVCNVRDEIKDTLDLIGTQEPKICDSSL